MDTTKKDVVEPKETLSFHAEDFAKKYKEICDNMGYRIVVTPVYTARDDGTFSLVLQYQVGALPKVEK